MTKKSDLESYLRSNPQAQPHAESIKDTVNALKELRAKGVSGGGYRLVGPYGGKTVAAPLGGRTMARTLRKLTFTA